MLRLFNQPIPAQALRHWLRGQAYPDAPWLREGDHLVQLGWTIQFDPPPNDPYAGSYPKRVILRQGHQAIKLAINEWKTI
jgi:outer membrane biogenesis lipoprotein LolB